jgi:hypothetical protein
VLVPLDFMAQAPVFAADISHAPAFICAAVIVHLPSFMQEPLVHVADAFLILLAFVAFGPSHALEAVAAKSNPNTRIYIDLRIMIVIEKM